MANGNRKFDIGGFLTFWLLPFCVWGAIIGFVKLVSYLLF